MAIDFGVASVLLLLCKYVRVKVIFFQRLYIPVAMMAGLLALALGTNGLDILPMSGTSYGSLLIAIIFAALGLSTSFPKASTLIHRTGKLWAYNQIITISQWILAIIVGGYLFAFIWPELPPAFGVIMPAGFMGGHGTAAGVGITLEKLDWDAGMSLALTSATIGVFIAILGGLTIINIVHKLGIVANVRAFSELGEQFRKGLIHSDNRESIGEETTSSSSINTFTLHISLIGVVVASAYFASNTLSSLNDFTNIPTFACAFLFGCLLRTFLKASKALGHFDNKLLTMSAGSATDFLVFFGIASIKLSVLVTFALPFFILMLSGLLLCVVLVLFVAPKIFGKNKWVETGVFSWGWMTGTVAMGILLLRIVDPESKSTVLDDYAIAYVPGSVVDIILVSFIPSLLMTGHSLAAIVGMMIYLSAVIIVAYNLRDRSNN